MGRGVARGGRGLRAAGRVWAVSLRGGLCVGRALRGGRGSGAGGDSLCAGGGGCCGGWAERRGAGRPGWRRPGAAGGSEEECTGRLRRWNGFGEPGSVEPKGLR